MRTYTWDYDANLVTEWLRQGACNQCGECCCRVRISLELNSGRYGTTTPANNGVWHQAIWSAQQLFWQVLSIEDDDSLGDCYAQLPDGCRDGDENKAALCSVWPLHPDHVACFNNCSYSFIKLREWELEVEVIEEEMVEEMTEEEMMMEEKINEPD